MSLALDFDRKDSSSNLDTTPPVRRSRGQLCEDKDSVNGREGHLLRCRVMKLRR